MAELAPTDHQKTLDRLAKSSFRAKFKLRGRELRQVHERGLDVMREHARDLLGKRLAPAKPARDGKQTPWRGHPVFVAQHATATCCRSCLEKWHGVARGQAMTSEEVDQAVGLIAAWLSDQLSNAAAAGRLDDLAASRRPSPDSEQPTLFD